MLSKSWSMGWEGGPNITWLLWLKVEKELFENTQDDGNKDFGFFSSRRQVGPKLGNLKAKNRCGWTDKCFSMVTKLGVSKH